MKKRLEAELISIAHRILKLKNKSEIDQLYTETRKLYETLSVLKFVEDNINIVQPKINIADIEQKLEENWQNNTTELPNLEPDLQPIALETIEAEELPQEEEIISTEVETKLETYDSLTIPTEIEFIKKENPDNDNLFLEKIPQIDFEKTTETKGQQISFESLLGHQFQEPTFERKDQKTEKTSSLNDQLSKGITFGLNDRIGFVKHLFAESEEDFNRVVSQITTFDSLVEAKNFINELVKPDYNNWENKEDYEARFIEIIEKKFL